MIEKVRNLNDICNKTHKGIYKRWLLNDKSDHYKLCDYMQKINYSIQDLNAEIPQLETPHMKSIVYAIILVVWIKEACDKIESLYQKDIICKFTYTKDSDLDNAKKYINAIRSFAIAHP